MISITTIITWIIFICLVLVAITVHEFAHALTAEMMGDPTPRLAGRLTLNPISHIDPFGFLMFLVARIGWAKPVPINPYNFRDPARGELIVSFAGPVSNFLLAWFTATVFRFLPSSITMNMDVIRIVSDFIYLNIALAVFNLIPIPPLDGSHILEEFIPEDMRIMLEQYGFFILIFIVLFQPTQVLLAQIITFIFKLIT